MHRPKSLSACFLSVYCHPSLFDIGSAIAALGAFVPLRVPPTSTEASATFPEVSFQQGDVIVDLAIFQQGDAIVHLAIFQWSCPSHITPMCCVLCCPSSLRVRSAPPPNREARSESGSGGGRSVSEVKGREDPSEARTGQEQSRSADAHTHTHAPSPGE